jgi:hypothetical protein
MSLDPTDNLPALVRRGSGGEAPPLPPPGHGASASASNHAFAVAEQSALILKTLYEMQQRGTLCDVTFVLDTPHGEERIPAHKAVLASGSPYFLSMFTSAMRESSDEEVRLPGMRSPMAFRLLLEFCYTGKINQLAPASQVELQADAILGVLELADLYVDRLS